jgi:aminoglycoside phosphotransferase (APT) family kinase protein
VEPVWTAEREVDAALARALIARQFPSLGPADALDVERIGVGWDNVAYQVAGRFVFRFPRRALAVDLLETERRVLPALAPRLPLPIPVPTLAGRRDDDNAWPWPFLGYERLPGRSACGARIDAGARRRAAAPLGAFLRALHAFPVDEAARLGAPGDRLGRADAPERLRQTRERLAEARARGLGGGALQPAHDRVCDEVEAVLLAPGAPGGGAPGPLAGPALVHGDLYARHLLVDAAGALCGVIDWGDVHLGHRAQDLGIAFMFLPPEARADFFAAYGAAPDAITQARARLRALFLLVSLLFYGDAIGDGDLLAEAVAGLGYLAAAAEPAAPLVVS